MLTTLETRHQQENARDHDNQDHDGNSNEQQTESHFKWSAVEGEPQ
jgi:hypothetical protein